MSRSVLISGASSDIGIALAKLYLDAGWQVVAHFRKSRPEFESLAEQRNFKPWQVDFAVPGALEAALERDRSQIEKVDAFVHLAAEFTPLSFEEAGIEDMLHAMRVNAMPAFYIMALLGPRMCERGYGRIVLGSSIGVKYGGGEFSFAYSLSKHSLEFIPSAARRWVRFNVLVNAVRIGLTDTRIHSRHPTKNLEERAALSPIGRAADAQEMARSLFWFGSEQNTYIHGELIAIAGGE